MTLAQVHSTPGVAAYMAEVEAGLARAVAAQPGLAEEVAGEALAAGGKRLRPLLCFLTARDEPSVAAGPMPGSGPPGKTSMSGLARIAHSANTMKTKPAAPATAAVAASARQATNKVPATSTPKPNIAGSA